MGSSSSSTLKIETRTEAVGAIKGCIIPAYWQVTQQDHWNTLVDTKRFFPSVPMIVILPLEAAMSIINSQTNLPLANAWRRVTSELADAGIRMAGRINTRFAERPLPESMGDAMTWRSAFQMKVTGKKRGEEQYHNTSLSGLMLDNVSNQFDTDIMAYYQELHTLARENGHFDFTIINASRPVPPSMVKDGRMGDIVIVKDSWGMDVVDSSYQQYALIPKEERRCSLAALANRVPYYDASWVAQMAQCVDYIFVTSGDASYMGGPPIYFRDLISHLETLSRV